jgi:alpha-glucosidase
MRLSSRVRALWLQCVEWLPFPTRSGAHAMQRDESPWWKRTTVYQIYPRSFADGNGDGVGDLRGVLERLDYLHDLGVETLWLSPFFSSPQADFGYDISDHYDVAPEYGTLDDCRILIDAVHARGMKIVFDMVLNHTSNQHPWFLDSRSSRTAPRRDWYIWRPGRGRHGHRPPNNWRSMLGPSGWHRDTATGEWYWASFLPFQPDLNYRNPEVKDAMLGVVRHWLEEGVDGLRLDIFNAIFKDASFRDNPFSFRPVPTEDNPHGFFQRHEGTIDHADTFAFARELRAVVDAVGGAPRFLVGEVFGNAAGLRRYCGDAENPGLHMVFLFQTLKTRFEGASVRALLDEFERAFPDPYVPTFVFGNHDRPRFMDRLDGDVSKAKLFAALQLTARGVPFIYYGEEIGTGHHDVPLHRGKDPIAAQFRFVPAWAARALRRRGILLNRDECRLPMAWHGGDHGGFSRGGAEPWLPAHPRYPEVNVAVQAADASSLLHWYRTLLRLRRHCPALHSGRLSLLEPPSVPPDVVAYRREQGRDSVHVLLNFSAEARRVDLPPEARVVLCSTHRPAGHSVSASLELAPMEALLLGAPPPPERSF